MPESWQQVEFEVEKFEDLGKKDALYLKGVEKFSENYELLERGVRSLGWDFSRYIERAELEGCAYVEELRELAAKISEVE